MSQVRQEIHAMTPAERIKDRLRGASDLEQLRVAWNEEKKHILALDETMKIQVRNLKDFRKKAFEDE